MPTSAQENKELVKEWIYEISPARVLDVGAGEGTYAKLLNYDRSMMTAIEAFYPYIDRYNLRELYGKVIVSDIRYFRWSSIEHSDIVIMGDMLEHMKKQEAEEVILRAASHSNYLLICVPIVHLDQQIEENEFETHVDHWSEEDMSNFLKDSIVKSVSGDILAYFLVNSHKLSSTKF